MKYDQHGVKYGWAGNQAVLVADPKVVVPLERRPLLTLKEASLYTGIGINKLCEMSNETNYNYVFFVGNKRMFKREALLRFIEEAYSV